MGNSKEYLEKFDELLECEFDSKATRKNYYSAVKSFLSFATTRTEKEPDILLRKYITRKLQNKAAKTVNLHRSAVVKFFELVKRQKITVQEVPRRVEPRKLPKIIDAETINRAIEKTLNIKHRIVLSIFFGCGLRLHEMYHLKRKNIFTRKHFIWLENTKKNKHRIVPVPESIREMLYEFICDMEPGELVFGGISKRTFEKIVANAFARVGEKASPHMLRHSFATHQIISGQNPFKVQSWLGHSSIKTTQTYVTLSQSMLMESTDLLKQSKNYTNQSGV